MAPNLKKTTTHPGVCVITVTKKNHNNDIPKTFPYMLCVMRRKATNL